MELAEATVRKVGNNYEVSHGDDGQLWVTFTNEAVKQEAESAKEGRPMFKDVPYITIMFPGDKTRKVVRPVRFDPEQSAPFPPDPERFPRHWAAFKSQQEQVGEGTPLHEWPPLTKSQVLEFKASSIHTVEQLANIPDTALHSLGLGGRELRDKAAAYLKQAKGGKEVGRLVTENAQLKTDIDQLKRQMSELMAAATKDKK